MSKTFRMAVSLIALIVMGALSACNAEPAEPTIDPNVIFTAAAQTVQAQLTVAAALNPTATATPEPTATQQLPTVPPIAQTPATNPIAGTPAVVTTQLILPTQPLALATLPPTATAVSADSSLIDRGEIVDQDPDDGTTLANDVEFDMVWTIKNTGTTTWTPGTGNCEGGYYLAFGGGERIGAGYTNWYCIKDKVAPGATTQFYVDMHTSNTTDGKYNSIWCLMNSQRKCIRMMDVTINVN